MIAAQRAELKEEVHRWRPASTLRQAFSRNIGWVTTEEQQILRRRLSPIRHGRGWCGHLLALARLGIGAFTIADFDVFDIVNFNRQAGAMMSTRPGKADVLAENGA